MEARAALSSELRTVMMRVDANFTDAEATQYRRYSLGVCCEFMFEFVELGRRSRAFQIRCYTAEAKAFAR